MKNTIAAIAALFIAFSFVLPGCSDNEVIPKISIIFSEVPGKIYQDTSIEQGAFMNFEYHVAELEAIQKVEISVSYDNGPRVTPANCTKCLKEFTREQALIAFSDNFSYRSRDVPSGTEKWFFKATNYNGETSEISVVVTNKRKVNPLDKNNVTLFNQLSNKMAFYTLDNPGYFSTSLVFPNDAEMLKLVNLLHLYDTDKKHLVCGPSSSYAEKLVQGLDPVSTWVHRTKTEFRKTSYTAYDLDTMQTTEQLIQEAAKAGGFSEEIIGLKVGDVIYIKLVNGNDFFLSVEAFDTDNTPGISLSGILGGHP